MKRWIIVLLLLALSGVPASTGDSRDGFRFRARLFSFSKRSESSVLKTGYILQPIDPLNREASYQSVALCEDVNLTFDGNGMSNEVEIVGFCHGPGMTVPLERVEWWIPGLVNFKIRDQGCDIRDRVRDEVHNPGPGMTEPEPVLKCEGTDTQCIEKFDSWLNSKYGISFLKAQDLNLCDRSPLQAAALTYGLFCDIPKLEKIAKDSQ